MKLISAIFILLFAASSGSALAYRTNSYYDPSCSSSCWGFCNGYFYNGGIPELNYYNPLCANVCCTNGGSGLAGGLITF